MKKYVCPMGCIDPQDEPGNCPECGMKLMEIKENKHKEDREHEEYDKHHGHKAKDFLKKFWLSLILTIPIVLFHLNIGTSYVPRIDLISLFLGSVVFFYGGWVFVIGAYREIKFKNLGMMTLIGIAITSAYLYSIYAVLVDKPNFLWELTSLITIMLLGHYFEMKSVSSAQKALQEIEKLLPDKAERIKTGEFDSLDSSSEATLHNHRDPKEHDSARRNESRETNSFNTEIIPLNEIKADDILLVRPGSKIPADGIVVEGNSEVNESMITGESKAVFKEMGSEVIAGTINGDGFLKIKVTKIGEETFLAGIKRLIKEAQKSKSRLQLLADVFAKYLTFIAIGVGTLSFVLWLIFQKDLTFALERLVTVLIIACPHALGLAVPLVVAISTSLAIHNGFLIRNRIQMELARRINVVLFDKTGTLTTGKFKVKEIIDTKKYLNFAFDSSSEATLHNHRAPKEHDSARRNESRAKFCNFILQISVSLNQYSQHFISQGILEKAKEENIEILPVKNFENLTGRGVKGEINGKVYYLGGENLLKELNISAPKIETIGTIVYLIEDKNILGAIVLEDEIREESKIAVKELHNMGVKIAMITGDKKEVAEKVAKELGIDEYFAEVLPQEKVNKVKELQNRGLKVMMVGDGINDAPALMQADVGVAIGVGTNVAIESAGVILVRNDPRDIVKLIKLSRETYKKMIQNLFWATGYNTFALPLATGILAFKGTLLSPALAAVFMSLSTIIVAINAMFLRKSKLI